MAFDAKGLVGFAHGAGTARLWHYSTTETLATVQGGNYFNAAAELLAVGDVIIVSGDTDGTPAARLYIVSSNDGSTVAITKSDTT